MEKLEDKAIELLDQLEALSPAATELAMQTMVVSGWQNVVFGSIFVSLAVLATFVALFGVWMAKKDDADWYIITTLFGVAALFAYSIGIFKLVSPWTWAMIHHPEVALTRDILAKLL